jgi:hypothetical protein
MQDHARWLAPFWAARKRRELFALVLPGRHTSAIWAWSQEGGAVRSGFSGVTFLSGSPHESAIRSADSGVSSDFKRTDFHLRLRLFALQKVGNEFVESILVLEHEPVPALPEDVHLHVRQTC